MKFIIIILGILFLQACSFQNNDGHFEQDKSFYLLSDSISANGEFKYLEYQFDHGAHGNSRVFWAVISAKEKDLELSEYILPDSYKSVGWTNNNELIVEKWDPYYYKSEEIELKNNTVFKGVRIIIKK